MPKRHPLLSRNGLLRTLGHCGAGIVLGFGSRSVIAAPINWNGGTGSWNDTTKWSGGSVPTSSDDVSIDNGKVANSTVNVNVSGFARSLTIDIGDRLNIQNSRTQTVSGGGMADKDTILADHSTQAMIIDPNGLGFVRNRLLCCGQSPRMDTALVEMKSRPRLCRAPRK